MKEKHVRSTIIGTFQEQSAITYWVISVYIKHLFFIGFQAKLKIGCMKYHLVLNKNNSKRWLLSSNIIKIRAANANALSSAISSYYIIIQCDSNTSFKYVGKEQCDEKAWLFAHLMKHVWKITQILY